MLLPTCSGRSLTAGHGRPYFEATQGAELTTDRAPVRPVIYGVFPGNDVVEDAAFPDVESQLFDAAFYLDRYPDVRDAKIDPLQHYRSWGAYEARDPNPFFSAEWYLTQNRDVLESGVPALQHYIWFGAKELRNPNPRFDAKFYVDQAPEAATNPLLFHLTLGRDLGLPTELRFDLAAAMPSGGTTLPPPDGLRVDIVIRADRGLAAMRRCLRSVLRDRARGEARLLHRIIVIDDATAEPGLARYLDLLAGRHLIHLLRNPNPLGVAASARRGIAEAGRHDVALLHAETEVPDGWLGRLAGHAYRHAKVATAAPFSNDAALRRSAGVTDAVCLAANAGRSVTIPTTAGACMYLRRDALDAVGTEAFEQGDDGTYEYCLRAHAVGWRHLMACDVFVRHADVASLASDALAARWPDYRLRRDIHARLDEAQPFRLAAMLQLFARNGLPTILSIEQAEDDDAGALYNHMLDRQCRGIANRLVLRATKNGRGVGLGDCGWLIPLRVRADAKDAPQAIRAAEAMLLADILGLITPLRIARIHIQHWVDLPLDLKALVRRLDVPFDLSIHDWSTICPRITLLPVADGVSCGEPGPAVCDRCIHACDDTAAHDITGWRAEHAWLPRLADRVLCATQHSIDRLARYGLAARAVLAPLEPMPETVARHTGPRRQPLQGRPLRVAVLGVLDDQTGAQAVTALAELATPGRLTITLIGRAAGALPAGAQSCLIEIGPYEAAALPALIDRADPDVVWFPAIWPETWSYTLTAAILSGRPIVASDIGTFSERLVGHPCAYLVPPDAQPATWIEAFAAAVRPNARGSDPRDSLSPERPAFGFYDSAYIAPLAAAALPLKRHGATDLRVKGKLAVILIPERLESGVLSPCAYIRMVLPLSHPASGHDIEVTLASVEEALSLRADLMMTHRYAVSDEAAATALLAHAARSGMPFVFDLDDNLVELPPDHTEAGRLQPKTGVVTTLLVGADCVHVSTPHLASRIAPFLRRGKRVQVIPNGLDERLWPQILPATKSAGRRDRAITLLPPPVTRILYMGSATHAADLELVMPALRRLHETFGSRIAIDLIGVVNTPDLPAFITRVEIPERAGMSYPGFVSWLSARHRHNPWAIGIAPLQDTDFNRCKSSIKVMDYAALGLPTVASDMPVYRTSFLSPIGEDTYAAAGYLAADPSEWYHALARLIRQPALRSTMAAAAAARLMGHDSLRAQASMRSAALQQAAAIHCLMV